MICPGDTKKSGAKRSVPALSLTLTVVPARVVGKGMVEADCVVVAKPAPKAATISSLLNDEPS